MDMYYGQGTFQKCVGDTENIMMNEFVTYTDLFYFYWYTNV